MATTRMIPMHISQGKSLLQSMIERTAYAQNPNKTHNGELISTFGCDQETAAHTFAFLYARYQHITGRSHAHPVIAYQLRQSFKPGEVTPEEANRIGYELAERFLKGSHAFLVATHTDRAHIHNHIIFAATTMDCERKFRNFWGSSQALSRLSDLICYEHQLSVIDHPQKKGVSYNKWLGSKAPISARDQLRMDIDEALKKQPNGFRAFLQLLEDMGWSIRTGKQPAFRAPNGKRFLRMDTLGDAYTETAVRAVLNGTRTHTPCRATLQRFSSKPMKPSLLIDIQQKLSEGKGAGYERWAKLFNIKQMAKAMSYLSEHHIESYDALVERVEAACAVHDALGEEIHAAEARMKEIGALKKAIIDYVKTKDVYTQWKASGWSADFQEAHRQEILLHQAARKAFDGVQGKLPTVKQLSAEYQALIAQKQKLYPDYRKTRDEMRELLIIKENIDRITSPREEEPALFSEGHSHDNAR